MDLTPIVQPQLLADLKLKPAAVCFRIGTGPRDTLLPFFSDRRFLDFAGMLPCFIAHEEIERLSPALIEMLHAAGCRILEPKECFIASGDAPPEPPADAHWIGGDWLFSPPARVTRSHTASRALSLKLLQLVAHEADTCEIETVFRQDPVLAYELLRLVNSLGVGVGKRISSFSQAIIILGRQQLKRWINLMLFSARRDDHRVSMLSARVAVRARHMELLAQACGFDRNTQDHAFMAGMFSWLGILFGRPLEEIIEPLKLNATLIDALLNRQGKIGHLLEAEDRIERGEDDGPGELFDGYRLPHAEHNLLALEAYRWMLNISLHAPDPDDA